MPRTRYKSIMFKGMKVGVLIGALQLAVSLAMAQTNAPKAMAPSKAAASASATAQIIPGSDAEAADHVSVEKHTKPILDALKLEDASMRASVRDVLVGHLGALRAWHEKNDAQLKNLWGQFGKARAGAKDETKADAILSQIDAVYASFKPEHEQFVSELAKFLTPEQLEKVKDMLTVNKVKITYDAYGQIFHGLTEEQKAFILKNLKAAREEAIDAASMMEKSAFFKKYKIKIEAYLTAQGYDVKQAYKDFVAKQKAEIEAKKAGTYAAPKPVGPDKQ